MKKKILIISVSSAGAGHVRAGSALEHTAERFFPNAEIRHIDLLDYLTLPVRKAAVRSYALLVKRLPKVWGFFYDQTKKTSYSAWAHSIMQAFQSIDCRELYEYIRAMEPNHILCTHFLPATILERKFSEPTSPKISLLLTDYDTHPMWLIPNLHYYFVATERMRGKMIRHGIPESRVIVSGIPIDPAFFESPAELPAELQSLPPNKKIVLILSGGYGLLKTDAVVQVLCQSMVPLTLLAVIGKNSATEQAVRRIVPPPHIRLITIGWTNHIEAFMRRADVVVTKPGGLTTTECIVLQKPIIAIDPIPGQEESNRDYILEHGYGVAAPMADDLLYYITQDPASLAPGYRAIATPPQSGKVILEKLIT